MTASEARLQLGSAAVLSPSKAAELLPFRDEGALRWLRAHDLVRTVPGLGEVVIWGEVVATIQRGAAEQEELVEAPRARRATFRRGRF